MSLKLSSASAKDVRPKIDAGAVPAPKLTMNDATQTMNTFRLAKTTDTFSAGHGFVDWLFSDAVALAMTANENPLVAARPLYNQGGSIFEEMYQDWARANPRMMAMLVITFAILSDDWLKEVFPVEILKDSTHVVWHRFIVDRVPAEEEVRNTGARILSGYNESGEMHMIYFAQMVSADHYRLSLEGGKAELNRRIAAMGENFKASVRLQTLKQIENTRYDMRAPEQLDPFRRLARSPQEVFQNRQSKFGMLDKEELGLEHLLAELSGVLGRGGRELGALIVKAQDYNALCNKSGGRFFYSYSGQKGITDRATGNPLPLNSSRDGSLLGVTIHQIPLLDMQMHNTSDGGILTSTVHVGSQAPFLNDTHDCEPHRYATNMRRIEFPSWQSNGFDTYHLHECMAYDLAHFYPRENCRCGAPPAGKDAGIGSGLGHEHYKGGRLNRPLLDAFCGPEYESDTGKIIEGSQLRKMKEAFARIRTKFPEKTHHRARIDNFLAYHPGREQWYPAQFIGEIPLELNPTELMLQSYRTMGRELLKGLTSGDRTALELALVENGRPTGAVIAKIVNNALRCTFEHVALSGDAAFSYDNNTAMQNRFAIFILDTASPMIGGEAIDVIRTNNKKYVNEFYTKHGFKLPETKATTERFINPIDADKLYDERVYNALVKGGMNPLVAHMRVYPLGGAAGDASFDKLIKTLRAEDLKLTPFAHRWAETFELATIEEQIGGRMYLLQANDVLTYQVNAKNNIANHNGGFVARPAEGQHMHSVVGTAAGPLGKVYANPMGTLTDYEAEIKEYGIEQGLFTGTVIEKTDALHIARNVRGGQVLGGKGKYFAVELLKRQVSGSGYNMMDYEDEDKPDNELFKRPIEKNTDQRLVDFGRYYYGRGDRFGNYSNFFFTQSANASKSENYVEDIDICGWWDPAAFTSTLRVSHAFDTEQHAPMWEGVALANYVYRFKDLMRTHQPFQQVDLDKYSFAEISAAEQHNTWLHTPTTKVYRRNEQFRKLRPTHPWGVEGAGLYLTEQSLGTLNPIIAI
jgi:hypothetical protein